MSKLTAEQRIERTHVQLMRDKNFCLFSGVFMIGKVEVLDKEITASTDGRNVRYGREFVDRLNDKQLAFLVIHEAMHKAYRHMMVWKKIAKENAKLANAAMDYVINLQICDYDPNYSVVEMPRDEQGNLMGLLDERFRGMDTLQVYEILKKECTGGDGGDGRDDGDGRGGSKGNGGQPDKPSDGRGGNGDEPYEFDEHDWEGASNLDEEAEQELGREIDHALREGAILAGKMKGNVPRGIEELLHPKVDWREALRDFVKAHTKGLDESTWRRPHRKYLGLDIIMPSTIGFKAERISIGTDTSGSIGGELIGRFLGETKLICDDVEPEIVDMIYWDSHVAKHEVYAGAEVSNLINSTKPAGGGGTEPDCVPTYLLKNDIKPQCLVVLTDGVFFGHNTQKWEQLGVPVLWCVVGNKDFVPKYGQAVCVE